MGKYNQAVVELEKATAEENPDGIVLDHLADAYFKMDKSSKAADAWKKALGVLEPEFEAARIAAIQEKIRNVDSE